MERIGDYVVRRLLGEGGMGKVYEAEERLSKRRVALKVLRPELTRSEEGRRLFLNEMQILAQLEHPNLVRSLASTEVDGQLVMALELLHGRTLRDELGRRTTLPWVEALEHVVHIAEALAVAHEHEPPVVHRDLKPENVMLLVEPGADAATADVTGLKVMDFGIAKVLAGMNATNTQSIGTLQYMSPEQIDAHALDARSDLYALGLLFYEMLAGKPPFRSASPRELLNLHCTAAPPPLDEAVRRGLPRGVEEVLFALLAKKPEDRPASARAVASRLGPFRAAGGPPVSVVPFTERLGAAPVRVSPATLVLAPMGAAAASLAPPIAPTEPVALPLAAAPAEAAKPAALDGGTKPAAPSGVAPEPAAPATPDELMKLVAAVGPAPKAPRPVPTWLAVAAIVVLSVAVGAGTYAARLRMLGEGAPLPTTTTSASTR